MAKKTAPSKSAAKNIPAAVTVPAKYIFLDVVGFTHQRSVEAQSEIVAVLNSIVRTSTRSIDASDLILLPTGDGMCICLIGREGLYDLHMQVALDIVSRISSHNKKQQDPMRQFQARVGINANVDNLVTDVNGRRNVAGAGINLAQRVMSTADGNQIAVGQPVYETLVQREKYLKAFRSYNAIIKHGAVLPVHQFVEEGHSGLDTQIPSQFKVQPKTPAPLTQWLAYYLGHALKNKDLLGRNAGRPQAPYASVVLLYFLAEDSVGASEAPRLDPYKPKVYGKGKSSIEEQLNYYMTLEFWVCCCLSALIEEKLLSPFRRCFETGRFSDAMWQFVSKTGAERLKSEWPGIWREFELETV